MTHAGMNGMCRLNPSPHIANILVQFPVSIHHIRLEFKTQYESRQGKNRIDGNVRIRLLIIGKYLSVCSTSSIQAYWFPLDFRTQVGDLRGISSPESTSHISSQKCCECVSLAIPALLSPPIPSIHNWTKDARRCIPGCSFSVYSPGIFQINNLIGIYNPALAQCKVWPGHPRSLIRKAEIGDGIHFCESGQHNTNTQRRPQDTKDPDGEALF